MTDDFPHASVLEGIRFTAQIGAPNVILGLFNKRELPTRIASTVGADYLGYRLVEGMVRSYGPGPFYVRVARDEALLLHDPADLEFVLSGSPDPFASDLEPKRKGMAAFQPDALTISRGQAWEDRRRFAVAVLDSDKPMHRLAQPFVEVAAETARELAAKTIRWQDFNAAFQRMTRRVIFGDRAADDTRLTEILGEMMSVGNKMPGEPAPQYDEFISMIDGYLDAPEPDSLASLIPQAPTAPDVTPSGQVIHWLFAMGDTLAANVFRALGALATHGEQRHEVGVEMANRDIMSASGIMSLDYLGGCLFEAMRLWPATTMFGRVTTRDVEFPNGAVLPAGGQVLIYNVFNHRNRDRISYADRFSPGEWASGDAGSDWSYNFFSHGPQVCPGIGLSMLLGQTVLAHLLDIGTPVVSGTELDSTKPLPHSLDLYGFSVDIEAGRW
ncbi:MAG: cytochrome P450 [Actinomycetia bacterium]|nr:cytochrome P450 [Actinomycetes bacterium]MCH9708239.1 cytochrome P450 [Actinomycetes bacterium]MCH9766331.1 cytochrome P450 [Actinomycetes bacterium]